MLFTQESLMLMLRMSGQPGSTSFKARALPLHFFSDSRLMILLQSLLLGILLEEIIIGTKNAPPPQLPTFTKYVVNFKMADYRNEEWGLKYARVPWGRQLAPEKLF